MELLQRTEQIAHNSLYEQLDGKEYPLEHVIISTPHARHGTTESPPQTYLFIPS